LDRFFDKEASKGCKNKNDRLHIFDLAAPPIELASACCNYDSLYGAD